MVVITQVVLFVLAGSLLYGLVGFLFRDQLTRRPMKAEAAGGHIIDMGAGPSGLERERQ
jgi:hypothetical protein